MDQALVSLLAASLAFVGMHFALSHPLRGPLVGALGENGFRALYSLVALATFVWAAMAFRAVGADGTPLWNGSGDALWAIATVIMLLASVLLAGSFQRNPALPDPRAAAHAALAPHGVFHVTRHPMMWSIALWAATHVRKKESQMGDAWTGWEERTSYWPRFGGLARAGRIAWIGGFIIWLAATYGHIHANGIPAGIWRWL
jgi:uncharacterized membrane protein